VPVEIAREQNLAAMDRFIEEALVFVPRTIDPLRDPNYPNVIDLNYVPPPHRAVKVTTGIGKSVEMRRGAARFVLEQRRRGGQGQRVMVLVPTHRLADEASSKMLEVFGARGISAAIYQSRDANDLKTGEPLCRNREAVKAANEIGADVQETCCKKGKIKCRFFDDCAFQRQRERAKMADVVFAPQELMFYSLDGFGKDTFGLVMIDEGFWQKGIRHDARQTRVKIGVLADDLDAHPVRDRGQFPSKVETDLLRQTIQDLQAALGQAPDGRLTRRTLLDVFVPDSDFGFGHAVKREWARKVDTKLRPDTPADERRRLVEQHKFLRHIPRRVRMWQALDEFLNGDQETAGRLILETVTENGVTTRYLRVLGKRDIHETFTSLPLLHGDATMQIELVRHYLPDITMLLELDVLAPFERITQIVGLAVGKKILELPADENDPKYAKQKARRDRLVALVTHLARGRRTLVICQKHVEGAFDNVPNVETAHYGAIEGLDCFGDVEVIFTIGRPMPNPGSVELTGSALTGKVVNAGDRKNRQRTIRLKDGTERDLHCKEYDNDDANLLCRAIIEAGVIQALGRSRAVNRTARNPVEAFVVLDDMTLPVPVDAVEHVCDVEPNAVDAMVARGLIPEWPGDAAAIYPDLFKNKSAAEYRYRRDHRVAAMFAAASYSSNTGSSSAASYSGNTGSPDRTGRVGAIDNISYSEKMASSFPLVCRYQLAGRRQRVRRALLSADVSTADARARIEAALGPLALFEVAEDGGHD
jgi:hypothetical protein